MSITANDFQLASLTGGGAQTNGDSSNISLFPDGTKMVFTSNADNLVSGDANGRDDVFVKDLTTGAVALVSSDSAGHIANFESGTQSGTESFSPDGTKVVFSSVANNLVAGDVNGQWDVFVKNLVTGATTIQSNGAAGNPGDSFSSLASFSPVYNDLVSFTSFSNNLIPEDPSFNRDIYLKNIATGDLSLVSARPDGTTGNSFSMGGVFSPDGTRIAFSSQSSDLVDGAGFNAHILMRNLTTGVTSLVSSAADGTPSDGLSFNPIFSPDGTKAAFTSIADNLVAGVDPHGNPQVFLKDLTTGDVRLISSSAAGVAGNHSCDTPVFSPDGTKIAFATLSSNLGPFDPGKQYDIYIKDLATNQVSAVTNSGNNHNPAFSPDGTHLYFDTTADGVAAGDTNGRRDIVVAALGDNHIFTGSSRADTFNGTDADETFNVSASDDTVHAGGGNDVINSSQGNDFIDGGAGDDLIKSGTDNDTVFGGAGNDSISASDGADMADGGAGNDHIHGGAGNDVIFGGGSSDDLYGDAGDDTLYGGTGTNHLHGGSGADVFVVNADAFDGHADKAMDFHSDEGDSLLLKNILTDFDPVSSAIHDFLHLTEAPGMTTVSIDRDGAGGAFALENVMILKGVTGLNVDDLYAAHAIVVA